MALDKAFFDSINIDVAKKKYYNVNKVESVLQDIRREAEALNSENASLREEVERMRREKSSVGDALISARELAQQIADDARAKADRMLSEAEEQRDKMLSEAEEQSGKMLSEAEEQSGRIAEESREQENYVAQYVLNIIERLKEQQLESVRQLNEEYQKFLCGLCPDDEYEAPQMNGAEPEETAADEVEDAEAEEFEPETPAPKEELFSNMETIPEDLREKVSAIARALRAIDGN